MPPGDAPPGPDSSKPFVASLELDELLRQLIHRADDVLAARERLRGLLSATQVIIGDLELPVVLHNIVDAACSLVDARYGAIGVLASGGGLEQFIYVGVDESTAARIGHLPTGKGLLGAVIEDPRPIRLASIADDPRSSGFPAGHPPMTSFLGVPIRVRDKVFGNLYLADALAGEFSADDEQVVVALAATAGVAIENARLFAIGERRQEWLEASAEITRELLSGQGEDPLALIARLTRKVADADIVSVVLPSADPDRLVVEVAAGEHAEDLVGVLYPRHGTLAGFAIDQDEAAMVVDAVTAPTIFIHLRGVMDVGPAMAAPLAGATRTRGALVVGRRAGRPPFEQADIEMATSFANQAAVALELADAQNDQRKLALLEDRDRIARDLHDHVIQRLFASGLSLESVASAPGQPHAERLASVITEIDEVIRQIRTSIFELRGPLAPTPQSLRTAVLNVVADMRGVLGVDPQVRFDGPVDTAVPEEFTDDVLAVVRESVTNVARHARATKIEITVAVADRQLLVEIVDDGIGVGAPQRRSGLTNLAARAEHRGGRLDIESPVQHSAHSATPTCAGTRLRWTIPLA